MLCLFFSAGTVASILDWQMMEIPRTRIFFDKDRLRYAQVFFQLATSEQHFVSSFIGHEPTQQVWMVEDMGVAPSNGWADPFTVKASLWLMPPLSTSVLRTYRQWERLVSTHERTHLAHLHTTSGNNTLMQSLFGEGFSPNAISPYWWLEGVAVVAESRQSPVEGRLNDPYFATILAKKCQSGQPPSLVEMTTPYFSYPFSGQYVYGSLFVSDLLTVHGYDKLPKVLAQYGQASFSIIGSFLPVLSFDPAFKTCFGKPVEALYHDWIQRQTQRHPVVSNNISVGTTSSLEGYVFKKYLTSFGHQLAYVSTQFRHGKPWELAFVSSLCVYDPLSQQEKIIRSFPTTILTPMTIRDQDAYLVLAQKKAGYANRTNDGFGTTGVLTKISLKDGQQTFVFEDDIVSFCLKNAYSLVYATRAHHTFGCDLWEYSIPTGQKRWLATVPYWISEWIRYNDRFFIVAKTNTSAWNVYEIRPLTWTIVPLVESAYPKTMISRTGEHLFFASHDGKKAALYQLHIPSKTIKDMTSSLDTYPCYPVVIKDTLYTVGITASGEEVMATHPSYVSSIVLPQDKPISVPSGNLGIVQEGLLNSLSTHAQLPQVRTSLIFNQDPLQALTYTALLSSSRIDVYGVSHLFAPARIGYHYESRRDGSDHWLFANTPLFVSQLEGLSLVSIEFATNMARKNFPSITAKWRWWDQELFMAYVANYGLADSSLDVYHHWSLTPKSLLSQQASLYTLAYPFRIATRPFFPENRTGRSELYYGVEWTQNLYPLRTGWWNPAIAIMDVFGTAFLDYGSTGNGFTAAGIEIGLEGSVSFMTIPFVPKFGIAWFGDTYQTYLNMDIPLM